MQLTKRQELILDIVKNNGPITGEHIAERLNLTRATLRPDMAILTMSGILEARPRVGYFCSGKKPGRMLADKLHQILVGEIKSVPVVVRESCTVYDAVVTMFTEDVGTLFAVREGGFLEGVISRKDLLKFTLGGQDIDKLPVNVVMTRMPNVVYVEPEDSIWVAARKLISCEVDALPVVKEVKTESAVAALEVIGRISKTNITKVFVELGAGDI
ncbi:MAG: helix-turn-helix transcriptional regulator [Firmicutes bacterium]|nr:helix-turn-helix transcriptional regulator [Bacillota bacterium]